MDQKEAYAIGRDAGYQAATYMDWTEEIPFVLSTEQGIEDPSQADKGELQEAAEFAAWDVEQNARQYSSFQHVAYEFNNAEPEWRMEGLWDKYDEGVGVGIRKGVRKILPEIVSHFRG